MVLRLIKNDISLMKWKDRKGIEWDYVLPDKLQKKTGGKLTLLGDVGRKGKYNGDILINQNEDEIPVYNTRSKIGFFETVAGYIECVEEAEKTSGFVRIINLSKGKIIGVLLVLLILLMSVGFFVIKQRSIPELDKAAVAYQMPEGAKNTDPNLISMPGITEIIYIKESNKAITPLINPDGNECYFSYQIILRETDEVIYKSKSLKPGMALVDYAISKDLEVGEYEISILADARSLKDPDTAYNTGQINATLKVVE